MSEGWPAGMFGVPKLFVTPIGVFTVRLRLNAGLVSPRVFPIAPDATESLNACDVPVIDGTVIFTMTVHVPPWPIVPPTSVTEPAPGAGAGVSAPFAAPVPEQVVDAPAGFATTMPAGNASVNVVMGIVAPALEFGFVSVIVSVTGSPAIAGDGAKTLLPVGFRSVLTDSVALAGVVLKTSTPLSFAV